MSEEQPIISNEDAVTTAPVGKLVEVKDEFVPKSAYEEVSRDMHKNKAKLKEERARANELEARLKANDEAKLVEAGKWKEAYEKVLSEKTEAEKIASEREARTIELTKKSALKQELGNIRDEYLLHADLNGIEVDENGTISSESVREIANKFRQDHAALLPSNSSTKMTSAAPASNGAVPRTGEKLLSDMNTEEKMALIAVKRQS